MDIPYSAHAPDNTDISDAGERVTPLYKNDCFYAHLSIYRFAVDFVKNKTVLDAGCGAGYGSAYFSENGARLVCGIDLSAKAIAFNQREFKRPNLEYRVMDLQNIAGFPDHHFDVIFSSNALEHVPDVFVFMRTAWTLLSSDGVVIIAVPPIINKWSREINEENRYHLNIWTPRQWSHVLGQFFSEVSLYRHHFDKPGITLDFANSPSQTTICENDFLFLPESVERFCEIGGITAIFVARYPKRKSQVPSPEATVSFIDESYTRSDGGILSMANYPVRPSITQLIRKGLRYGREHGIIALAKKTYHFLRKI